MLAALGVAIVKAFRAKPVLEVGMGCRIIRERATFLHITVEPLAG